MYLFTTILSVICMIFLILSFSLYIPFCILCKCFNVCGYMYTLSGKDDITNTFCETLCQVCVGAPYSRKIGITNSFVKHFLWVHPTPGKSTLLAHLLNYFMCMHSTPGKSTLLAHFLKHFMWVHPIPGKSTFVTHLEKHFMWVRTCTPYFGKDDITDTFSETLILFCCICILCMFF